MAGGFSQPGFQKNNHLIVGVWQPHNQHCRATVECPLPEATSLSLTFVKWKQSRRVHVEADCWGPPGLWNGLCAFVSVLYSLPLVGKACKIKCSALEHKPEEAHCPLSLLHGRKRIVTAFDKSRFPNLKKCFWEGAHIVCMCVCAWARESAHVCVVEIDLWFHLWPTLCLGTIDSCSFSHGMEKKVIYCFGGQKLTKRGQFHRQNLRCC